MERYYYDADGSYSGYSTTSRGSGGPDVVLSVMAAIAMAFYDWVITWESHDAPYSYIAGFYNLMLGLPVRLGETIFRFFAGEQQQLGLTLYPNLNLILGLTSVCLFAFLLYKGVCFLFAKGWDVYILVLLVLPGLLAVTCRLGELLFAVVSWLFA